MFHSYRKIVMRIKKVGLSSTVLYIFITVFLGRLGIDLNYLFKTALLSSGEHQDDIKIVRSISDLPVHYLDKLKKMRDLDIHSYFTKKFENKNILALGIVDDAPVSLSWIYHIDHKHDYLKVGDWVIHSCLTFSDARGFGFYPRSISALKQVAFEQWQGGRGNENLYMECSIVNKASIRGIEKSGLTKTALLLKLGGKKIFKYTYV